MYTPTLMEKLLGGWYKWWYFVKYVFKLNFVYLVNEILTSLNKTFFLLSSLIIFTFIQKENVEIISYLIIGNLFFAITDANNSWFLGNYIKDGKLARILILPQNIFKYLFFNGLSNTFYMAITYLASLIPISILFSNNLNFTGNIFYLILFWPIPVMIRLFLEILTGLTAFWTTEFYGAAFLNSNFLNFFSGSLFPLLFILDKFPILAYTPYSLILHHPMQIYLGKYDANQTILVFLGGIAWCAVLYLLAKLVFKLGLKRNESVGL
jgi:ABC-2 type transport system permease protein